MRQVIIPDLEGAGTAQRLCPGAVGSLGMRGLRGSIPATLRVTQVTTWLQDQEVEARGGGAAGRSIRGPELSPEAPEDCMRRNCLQGLRVWLDVMRRIAWFMTRWETRHQAILQQPGPAQGESYPLGP